MEPQASYQPWKAVLSKMQDANKDVKLVADTDTFKKGEAIVIGGQSKWGKKQDSAPTPTAKGLWYDTQSDQGGL